jgi:hypothetical protein
MFIKFIKNWQILFIIGISIVFFWQFITRGLLPIPSDTIVGLYHPFRDFYSKEYPRGVPFKNFLISDPVRQIIPWKTLSLESLSKFELPLWNPYEMAGKPLLGNFQSSPLYPLNLILFIKPFQISWSIFIMAQLILAGLFMFFYLRNLALDPKASIVGAIAFSFSGFSIAWLQWGNIVHTALWLPLILLSIDKVFENSKLKTQNSKLQLKSKKLLIWLVIFLFSLVSSFFAGHLQIFFYLSILSIAYFVFRWFEYGKKLQMLILFTIYYLLFTIATAVKWIPTLQFVSLSARSLDQNYLDIEGWFIPWQHLVQFIIPDFFGNPSTLNYWGTWNYGELVGYIGIVSIFFVVLSLVSGVNRTKLFFLGAITAALLLGTENPISKIPYELNIPLISSSQPTRIIFLIVFGLSVLAAFGLDRFLKQNRIAKEISISFLAIIGILGTAWIIGIINPFNIAQENLSVLRRNLIFPTGILGLGLILVFVYILIKNTGIKKLVLSALIAVMILDLLRFGWKFTPFTNPEYFYPRTKVIEFLKRDRDIFRIATTDSRILAPNIATFYKIQSISGYDPLYLQSYAELIAASERGEPNINPPFGFNRIINPHNLDSKIIDILNVKYVLSLTDLDNPKFVKVFQEGETRVYENKNVLPRAFFVKEVKVAKNDQEAMNIIFSDEFDPRNQAVIFSPGSDEKELSFPEGNCDEDPKISSYEANKVVIKTEKHCRGFLVFTDSFYPTWRADSTIFRTNYNFRGIYYSGKEVTFRNSLFSID